MATQPVDPQLRKTGIGVVGDVPWGTHFFMFYETKQDLLDTLVPYFKAGLESNEFCLWIISKSEPVTEDEAMHALRQAIPDIDQLIKSRNIEMLSHEECFFDDGRFDFHKVVDLFKDRLAQA